MNGCTQLKRLARSLVVVAAACLFSLFTTRAFAQNAPSVTQGPTVTLPGASTTGSSTTGSSTSTSSEYTGPIPNVGPHEAGNLPTPPTDNGYSNVPMVIIFRANELPAQWQSTYDRYSMASERVIRIAGIDVTTKTDDAIRVAQNLNELNVTPGTIVVFGNEMSSLDREWHSRAEPTSRVPDSEVTEAALQYGVMFDAFFAALDKTKYKPAVAAVDVYNGNYSWDVWVSAVMPQFAKATALVANVYDVPNTPGINAYKLLEEKVGKKVEFFTEWGPHPDKNVYEHVEWLKKTPLPAGIRGASTLIPDRCGATFIRDVWLYYSKGKVYAKDGRKLTPTQSGGCNGDAAIAQLDPVYMYPKTLPDVDKYLANSQVYCAPRTVFLPQKKGLPPNLGGTNSVCREGEGLGAGLPGDNRIVRDNVCTAYEYPITEQTYQWNLAAKSGAPLSFPLFRDQAGGMSIEQDLTRLDPNDTWFQALQTQTRADSAPTFYLSSPQTQCNNVVRFIEYVQKVCKQYDASKPLEKCGLNIPITLASGEQKQLLEFAELFPNEMSCENISDDLQNQAPRAQALQSISPRTPKLFKMAFVVQYTHLQREDYFEKAFYMVSQLATWFKGSEPSQRPFVGEKLDVVPIWYHAGIAVDAFDQYADPATGEIRPYAFDPTTLTGQDSAKGKAQTGNFLGAWTKTYEALMPTHFQETIAERRMKTVWENAQLMQQAQNQWTQDRVTFSLPGLNFTNEIAPLYCGSSPGVPAGESCLCFKEDGGNCQNQPLKELISAFPNDFKVDNEKEFGRELKKKIVTRIKSGWQRAIPFDPAGTNEVTSVRSLGWCPNNAEEAGVQEETTRLGSSAQQNPDNIVEKLGSTLRSKITWLQGEDTTIDQHIENFLILPDEAMTIEIAQSYIAPMFLSPEMYSNIMTGESPMFPLNEIAEEKKREPFYSAFLRTIGFTPEHEITPEGYVLVEPTVTSYSTVQGADGECSVTNPVKSAGAREWITIDAYEASIKQTVPATCENPYETSYNKIDGSSVELKYQYEDKDPNPNPETPGQLAAMGEFIRRLAFTPLHQIKYTTYPGLEAFYGGGGQQLPETFKDSEVVVGGLSEYFQNLIKDIGKSYKGATPVGRCDAVYVSAEKAKEYGDALKAVFANESFRESLAKGKDKFLYKDCGGMNCVDFITQITTSTPVCDGKSFINPYMAFAVATNETLGLTNKINFHYGCNAPAFVDYKHGASIDGMQCAVMNGAGNTVINPAIVAKYGQVSTQVASTCIAGGPDAAARRANTPEDGLACFMSVMQYQCRKGENDYAALYNYGYKATTPIDIIARIDEAATLANRHDPSLKPLTDVLRRHTLEMKQNMARCTKPGTTIPAEFEQ